ncbi:MAG: hypothetical protein LCH39_13955, partial [Proteobacteria bacterium]|nr:hypothetical protein [Pseudomonadota bacterium]
RLKRGSISRFFDSAAKILAAKILGAHNAGTQIPLALILASPALATHDQCSPSPENLGSA